MSLLFVTDDSVDLGTPAALRLGTDDYCMSCWIKTSASSIQRIIGDRGIGAGKITGYQIELTSGGAVTFLVEMSAGPFRLKTTNETVNDGAWHHIVFVWDISTNNMRIYIDSVVGTLASSTQSGTVTNVSPATNLIIGATPTGQRYFDGQISEVAIWKGPFLSVAEIAQLFNPKMKRLPLQIQASILKTYLGVDDGLDGVSADGATVKDISGNGNDGTGDDGANNTGLTWKAGEALSYPPDTQKFFLPIITTITLDAGADKIAERNKVIKPFSDATFSINIGAITQAWYDIEGSGDVEIFKGSYATLQDAVQAFEYTFNTTGTFTAQLKVQSNGSVQSTDTLTVTVENPFGTQQVGYLKEGEHFRSPRNSSRIYVVRKKNTPTSVIADEVVPQTNKRKKNKFLILNWADKIDRVQI